jgi:transposase
MVSMTLGIDVACRAEHQATFAVNGRPVWRGRKFFTRPAELERLWADLDLDDPAELTVVLEPTRNAWIVLAQWFRRRGARVVMVPTTQSADLRAYFSKHTGWYAVLGSDYGKAALAFLARYADPHAVLRLGQARLARFLQARSRGQYGPEPARALVAAAKETLLLWGPDGMDFAELAADIAAEAEQAIFLNGQIKEIEERIANLYAEADPEGIIASAPGVGPVTSAVIAGRVGDPHRFTSLAAIRAYSGLVPKTSQSGTRDPNLGLTKAGDPLLREALFMAADHARLVDPQLAAKYVRLMSGDRHRDSAVCHLAANLLTRIAACWRTGQPYVIRDVDGREITEAEGKAIVKARYKIDQKKRVAAAGRRMKQRRIQAADRESQKSLSAPTSRPATTTVDTTPITVEVA